MRPELMPDCAQVKLLLGPFDDGELEPHEMEDVALHVVTCAACKGALEDYRMLGVGLRDCISQPSAPGFTNAVLRRIDELPRPLRVRIGRRLDSIAERIGAGFALLAAGAFAAIATVLIVTPAARSLLMHQSTPAQQIVFNHQTGISGSVTPTADSSPEFRPSRGSQGSAADVQVEASASDDPPTITVSDDPETTVIWVPPQP
jgi:Putative zinc-finger